MATEALVDRVAGTRVAARPQGNLMFTILFLARK